VNYFVALPFTRLEEGLAPGEAVECPHADSAIRRSEAPAGAEQNAAPVAFSRQGNPDLGEFDDAVILRVFGDVPDDLGIGG
jgi:hypothetical protein